jgi:tetratricopeptide (TPR) repeat protein
LINELANGNIESAITVLQNMPDAKPDDVKPLSMGVRLMLDHLYIIDATDFQMPTIRTKMDAALALADRAIRANPNVPDGWAAKALALNWAYRSSEALVAIQHALTIAPQNPTALAVQAEIYAELRRYTEAQSLLDDVIRLAQASTPLNQSALARAYYIRGNIEQILGQNEQAIAAYEAAWAISSAPYNPRDPWMVVPPGYILYQLGPIYLFEGKGNIALQRYTAALQVDKQDPFLYYLRGRVYRYNGDITRAADEFQHCVSQDSHQWRCWRNLGQMAFDHTDWEESERDFQPILNDNSQISDDYYYFGAAQIDLKECKKAIPTLNKGLTLLQNATGKPHWTNDSFNEELKRCPH